MQAMVAEGGVGGGQRGIDVVALATHSANEFKKLEGDEDDY